MLDIIKNNNPLLIVYPTGAGGEFISMTIANNSSNFNNLKYQYRSDNNQIHTHSPIKYTSMWSENDSNTLIDNTVILKDNGSTSAKTKLTPFAFTALAAPTKLIEGEITSSVD